MSIPTVFIDIGQSSFDFILARLSYFLDNLFGGYFNWFWFFGNLCIEKMSNNCNYI